MKLVNDKNLYQDGIGYIEQYDFSTANRSYEDRVKAVSTVASICYGKEWKGTDTLFKRLGTESKGLPSSSYEFVPILLNIDQIIHITKTYGEVHNTIKYGEWVEDEEYLLTNLRTLIADIGSKSDQFYNTTEEEINIIKKHYKVFKTKIPLFVARQYMRHRVSWQEQSRRYISDKKQPFEFYISKDMYDIKSHEHPYYNPAHGINLTDNYSTQNIYDLCVEHYHKALEQGIKPQEARIVLPQSMYTTMWSAWYPKQLESFIELRTEAHTQEETRELAIAKQQLLKDK